jgi:hypothetical protein
MGFGKKKKLTFQVVIATINYLRESDFLLY